MRKNPAVLEHNHPPGEFRDAPDVVRRHDAHRPTRQQVQQLALLRRGLHGGVRMRIAALALAAEHFRFAERYLSTSLFDGLE